MDGAERGTVTLAVDARGLYASGIGRYLREVLRSVFADARFRRTILLGKPDELREFVCEQGAEGVTGVVAFPYRFYSPTSQLHWAALQAQGRLRTDVAFFPHYDVPLFDRSRRTVLTVQDLSHFKLSEQFPVWKRLLASRVLARAVHRASRVIVTSSSTRRDLLERHPDVAGRLEVIPLGVNRPEGGDGSPTACVAEIEGWGDFLLCVGNRKPHKNLVAAVETLARVRRQRPGIHLVLAGADFGEDADVRERAARLGVEEAVVWFGRASEAELMLLYRRAGCLLFPSLYEGFGLPPLEAMAAGLPVVASDRASVPEVVGDAAAVVAPHDWDAMAAATLRLLCDPEHRAEMVRRGRERAACFRWEDTAANVAELLWREATLPTTSAVGRGRLLHRTG